MKYKTNTSELRSVIEPSDLDTRDLDVHLYALGDCDRIIRLITMKRSKRTESNRKKPPNKNSNKPRIPLKPSPFPIFCYQTPIPPFAQKLQPLPTSPSLINPNLTARLHTFPVSTAPNLKTKKAKPKRPIFFSWTAYRILLEVLHPKAGGMQLSLQSSSALQIAASCMFFI